jgi:Zn-dependent peptidase ImmA (M78 family)
MRRGFKTEAQAIATEVRDELGVGPLDPLNPFVLAAHLLIPVVPLSEIAGDSAVVALLLGAQADAFSAVTVFRGTSRTIVHNDSHSHGRRHSNLAHEISHALLHHPPIRALDERGCRVWEPVAEEEASWLGGCLLITEAIALAIAQGRWSRGEAATHFGVSPDMIRFRVNVTGAAERVQRAARRRNGVRR